MPSRYEPGGLNQLYSLRYGTVPVVRATGGLDDTIEEWNPVTRAGNGFKFYGYRPSDFLAAIDRALAIFAFPGEWRHIMRNGMQQDFGWSRSAQEYARLYEEVARRRG
jgi:starch synthase